MLCSELKVVPENRTYRLLAPGPVVLISTTDGVVPNAAPIAWLMPCDFGPARFALVLGKQSKTIKNLMSTRECVLNVCRSTQRDLVLHLGSRTGHDGPKLHDVGVFPAERVQPPCLEGSVAWIECTLENSSMYEETEIVIVRALHARVRADAAAENGGLTLVNNPLLHHLGGDSFCTSQ